MLTLYKYLSMANTEHWQYRQQLIGERRLYFGEASSFNDPLDCNIAKWEAAKSFLKPARFFCLSLPDRDDGLMFAHYGDEHRGIRLRFEVDDDQAIRDCGVLAMGRPVIYNSAIPEFNSSNAHHFYFMKSKSWQYESEYRIILVENTEAVFATNELKEIALGYRFNMDFLPVLQAWVERGEHSEVSFVRAVPSQNALQFDYEPVNA